MTHENDRREFDNVKELTQAKREKKQNSCVIDNNE